MKHIGGKSRRYALVAGVTGCMLYAATGSATEAAPDAMTVLKEMARVYSNCKTYQDTGACVTKYVGDNPVEKKLEFRTAFRRPTDFRFEYSQTAGTMPAMGNRKIVQRDPSGTRSWWSLSKKKQDESSLGMALAAATGVSDKTAHTVPRLLLPTEIRGRTFVDDAAWTLLTDAEESGHACHRVTHTLRDGASETLWIDKTSSLLIRIDETLDLQGRPGPSKMEQTTLYKPQMDQDIPQADLSFGAPAD